MTIKSEIKKTVGVFLLLAGISVVRQIWLHRQNWVLTPGQAVTIFLIYMICLNIWWNSVRLRVTAKQVRLYLLAEHWLMVISIVVRLVQSCITVGVEKYGRMTGYFFIVPGVLLFLFGFYAAYLVGKPWDAELPKFLKGLLIPAVILILLTLTNDLHYLVYRRTEARAGLEAVFEPTGFFVVICVWIAALEIAKIICVFRGGRRITNRCLRWLPTLISVGFMIYSIPYILSGFAVAKVELLEFVVGMFFFEGLLWESCIITGLFPVNSHYRDIFHEMEDKIWIVREDGMVFEKSYDAGELTMEQWEKLKQYGETVLSDDSELHMKSIRGGYVIWQSDNRTLRRTLEELQDTRMRLAEEDVLLRGQLQNRSQSERVAIGKRLYRLVQERTLAKQKRIMEILREIRDGVPEKEAFTEAIDLALEIKQEGIQLLETKRSQDIFPKEERI